MPWYFYLLSALIPIFGFYLGYLMGSNHQSRLHAQRRRVVNER